jgi:hypothetical protein
LFAEDSREFFLSCNGCFIFWVVRVVAVASVIYLYIRLIHSGAVQNGGSPEWYREGKAGEVKVSAGSSGED